MATEKDKIIEGLYKLIEDKKKEIAKAEKPSWETNCVFKYNKENQTGTNLQVCSSVEDLVHMLGFLIEKQTAFDAAQKVLGTNIKFKWLGFSFNDWKSDIQTRVAKLEITAKKREIEILEEKLNGLDISKEVREQMELEQIKKLLEQ